MKDEFDYKFEILMKELDNHHSAIRAYDTILFTIKGWAITVVSGLLLFTLQQGRAIYIIFCIGAIFLFWMLDALNKSIQIRFMIRNGQVESFLRSTEFSEAIKQRSFGNFIFPNTYISARALSRSRYWPRIRPFLYWNVSLLYVMMLFLTLLIGIWMAWVLGF